MSDLTLTDRGRLVFIHVPLVLAVFAFMAVALVLGERARCERLAVDPTSFSYQHYCSPAPDEK